MDFSLTVAAYSHSSLNRSKIFIKDKEKKYEHLVLESQRTI